MFLTFVFHLIAVALYGIGCVIGIVALFDIAADGVVLFTDPKTTLIYCGIAVVGGIDCTCNSEYDMGCLSNDTLVC